MSALCSIGRLPWYQKQAIKLHVLRRCSTPGMLQVHSGAFMVVFASAIDSVWSWGVGNHSHLRASAIDESRGELHFTRKCSGSKGVRTVAGAAETGEDDIVIMATLKFRQRAVLQPVLSPTACCTERCDGNPP